MPTPARNNSKSSDRCTHAPDADDGFCVYRCAAALRAAMTLLPPVVSCLCTSVPVVNGRCLNCDGLRA